MKKMLTDERIIEEARKQNSMGFILLYYGLLLVLLYRQFILRQSFAEYWDVALLFFGITFYMAARRINSGLLANKLNPLSIVPSALIAAVVFVGVQYFWHMSNTLSELVICGLVFLACFFGLNLLMQYFSSKKNDDLLKQ